MRAIDDPVRFRLERYRQPGTTARDGNKRGVFRLTVMGSKLTLLVGSDPQGRNRVIVRRSDRFPTIEQTSRVISILFGDPQNVTVLIVPKRSVEGDQNHFDLHLTEFMEGCCDVGASARSGKKGHRVGVAGWPSRSDRHDIGG